MLIIETKNLTKYYGKKRGIEGLDLEVQEGEVFGFLGPNGAGKTTTIRTLLHLISPNSGKAYIFGKEVKDSYAEILSQIGYLPGDVSLYEEMTGSELLDLTKVFYRHADQDKYAEQLIDQLEIDMNSPFKKLSKGNRQKIGILLALAHKPKLLILDEPTTGLDPLSQIEFYKILDQLKNEGTTIFFSSHNLREVEKVADRTGIIRQGRLISVQSVKELRKQLKKIVEIVFTENFNQDEFLSLDGAELIESDDRFIRFNLPVSQIQNLLKVLESYKIQDIDFSYPDLEKIFLHYYQHED